MRFRRTLPPAAAPLTLQDLINGFHGLIRPEREIHRFSTELRTSFQTDHVFLVSSGQAALTLILRALHRLYPDRDEVLIPAYTCYSVPAAVVRAGLKIRLCDIDPQTLDFVQRKLANLLEKWQTGTSRILALVPVHLFGLPADMQGIRRLAETSDIPLVEDAAQAMGAKTTGQFCGKLGHAGFFSLGRGKALSTVAGGVILTEDKRLGQSLASEIEALDKTGSLDALKQIFQAVSLICLLRPGMFWLPKGLPFLQLGQTVYDPAFCMARFSGFQAGLSRNWKQRLQAFQSARAEHARYYAKRFQEARPDSDPLLQKCAHWAQNGIRYPVLIPDAARRKQLLDKSEALGLGLMPGYPESINTLPQLRKRFQGQAFPGAEQTATQLITLPVHPYVRNRDREQIAELVIHACRSETRPA
ncbi:MAG: DegT/DnrJ/EryC1/StrS family aminotransferase [Desulfohalobiaceae bacterium]|nr:DegT/DnrJ/EryC1/StrS family aminotransferase [Desulfohalobiaceae bacterium]